MNKLHSLGSHAGEDAAAPYGLQHRNQQASRMCLSAPVSFAAAAVLVPVGALALRRAWRGDRRFAALSALPLLMGVQQFIEGLVWISGASGTAAQTQALSLVYMFFAWLLWPVWIPLSVYFIEPHRRRAAYLIFALAGGMLGAAQYAGYLAHSGWLEVTFLDYAIRYSGAELLDAVTGRPVTYLAYVAILITPLLMSTDRRVRVFGALVTAVVAVTAGFFQWAYISVFCFGGAVISLYILWALREGSHPDNSAAAA